MWWMFSWHSSSSSWLTKEPEIIRRERLPFDKLKLLPGYYLGNKFNIYFHVSRVSFIKLLYIKLHTLSYSSLDRSVVERVLKSSSCFSCSPSCHVYALVPGFSHLYVTHSPSQPAVPQHPLCALQKATFWGTKMKLRCSLILKSFKVVWDTDPKLQSMP